MSFTSASVNEAVEEIVGPLTKAEVLAALPVGWIRAGDAKTWSTLKDAVFHLSNGMKRVVQEAASTKDSLLKEKRLAGKKRKREYDEWIRRTRRRGYMEGEVYLFKRLIK
jgi:hypothetical protein